MVWSLARASYRNRADAEDAVQRIFIELWRVAEKFDPALGSETTFVSIVARRRLSDWNRGGRRRRDATIPLPEGSIAPGHRTAEEMEEMVRAARSISELSHSERLVLGLAFDRGLPHRAVARATGYPLGTVKTHVRRGLIKLRALIQSARESDPAPAMALPE